MRIIPSSETLNIEFKSDKKGLPDSDLIEVIVAFANTEGGICYLGVEDDGEITGISKKHSDPSGVAALILNKTVPPVSVRADILKYKEYEVLQIEVPKSHSIIATSDGRTLRRRLQVDGTPENVPFFPHEMAGRLSSLNELDYSDQVVLEASIDDFDPIERSRLRNIIRNSEGENGLLRLSDDELDRALRFVRDINGKAYPTITGLLLLGKAESIKKYVPTAKASFQVLEGGKVRVNEDVILPLLSCFELFESYFNAWNPEKEFYIGMQRIPIKEFSSASFREALVNAYSHRDYTVMERVRVLIDDDGLTITSPGGFVEGITFSNLLTAEPRGRNLVLSDAFKRIGLAERTGRGIDTIISESIINGKIIPDYSESTNTLVRVFIPRSESDIEFCTMIRRQMMKEGRSLSINALLILYMLRREKELSMQSLMKEVNLSQSRIESVLNNLIEDGLVLKNGKYKLNPDFYKKEELPDASIADFRIVDFIALKGLASAGNISKEFLLTRNQTYYRLKALLEKGEIKKQGKGRNTYYSIS